MTAAQREPALARNCVQPRADVIELADCIIEGVDYPLVPDGEYLATYQGHECVELRQFRGAAKVFIRLRLVDAGVHTGKVLFRAYRVKRRIDSRRFVAGRRSHLVKDISRILDVPGRPDRISLSALRRHLLRIQTRTVTRDADQHDLPTGMRYSVVADILGKDTA
jgi:hypothetical protein